MSGMEAIAHALAGSTGGIVAMTLLYPLENVRTRLQVQVKARHNDEANSSSGGDSAASKLQHTCDAAGAEARPAEECIAPESRSGSSASKKQQKKHKNKDDTSSSPPFALHSPRVTPLPPPCAACAAEGARSASTVASVSAVSGPAAAASTSLVQQPPPYVFRNSWDVVRQVSAREGWTKLYSGLNSALIGVGVSSAVYFFWYYSFKTLVLSRMGATRGGRPAVMGPVTNLCVASAAGLVNVLLTLPIWLVNTRITLARPGEYRSVWDAVRQIHAAEGVGGFYRGLAAAVILVSNPAIQFCVYEQLVALWTRAAQKLATNSATVAVAGTAAAAAASSSAAPVRLSSLQYFVLGAFAKAVATLATYPYQSVKTRLQASKSDARCESSTWSTIAHMWRTEGAAAFYQGMGAKLSQTVLNAAFMFATYERLVRLFLRVLSARKGAGQ